MDIKFILEAYGLNDYYEMSTGRIYLLSQIGYDSEADTSSIPVSENGNIIGVIKLPGNIKEKYS